MNRYFDASALPVKTVFLILTLTLLIALHISPAAESEPGNSSIDTIRSTNGPTGLIPWAISTVKIEAIGETLSGFTGTSGIHYKSPDKLITDLVDGPRQKSADSITTDINKFDCQH